MRLARNSLITAAAFLTMQALGQPLSFEEAVRRAADRGSERERARLAVAVAQQNYLESQSKFRWEFRPRIGLLSFSNPLLLASSIGGGLSIGRNQPPESVRHNARLDSLAAEVALERVRMVSQMEATRAYFNAVQREQLRDHLAETLRAHQEVRKVLDERTKSAHATILSRGGWELRSIALEAELQEAEDMVGNAKSNLATLIGIERPAEDLQLSARVSTSEIPEVLGETFLHEAVFSAREAGSALRQKLDVEKKRTGAKDSIGFSSFALGYSRIDDHRQPATLLGQGGTVLGNHTGTFDFGIRLPLRKTREEDALKQYAAARLRSIELDLDAIDDMRVRELEAMKTRLTSSRRKADVAAKRLKVLSEVARLIELREQSGLETAEAKINADADLVRARCDLVQAQTDVKISWMQLNAASTLHKDARRAGTMISSVDTPSSDRREIVRPLP